MLRILKVATVAAGVLLMAGSAFAPSAFALEVGVRGMYWGSTISGDIQTVTNGVPGTDLDVKSDLGMEDENVFNGEVFLKVGHFTFRVAYTPLKFTGSAVLSKPIVFDGVTFPAGIPVSTKLETKMIDGDVQWDFLNPDLGVVSMNLGVFLRLKYVDGSAEVASNNTVFPVSATQDFRLPIPEVGVAAGFGILKDIVRVDARACGMAYSGNHLYEGDAFLSVIPFPFLRLQGGYRFIDLKADEDDFRGTLKIKGPYAGIQVAF
jgi:outer membrane protein